MAIIKSVGAQWAFILSEANDWRSRDEITIDNGAGTTDIEPGTLLVAGATPADPYTVWTGTGTADAILLQRVHAGEDVRRTVIARDAEVNGHELVIPAGANFDTLRTALAGAGIVVRTNKGRTITAVPVVDGSA